MIICTSFLADSQWPKYLFWLRSTPAYRMPFLSAVLVPRMLLIVELVAMGRWPQLQRKSYFVHFLWSRAGIRNWAGIWKWAHIWVCVGGRIREFRNLRMFLQGSQKNCSWVCIFSHSICKHRIICCLYWCVWMFPRHVVLKGALTGPCPWSHPRMTSKLCATYRDKAQYDIPPRPSPYLFQWNTALAVEVDRMPVWTRHGDARLACRVYHGLCAKAVLSSDVGRLLPLARALSASSIKTA